MKAHFTNPIFTINAAISLFGTVLASLWRIFHKFVPAKFAVIMIPSLPGALIFLILKSNMLHVFILSPNQSPIVFFNHISTSFCTINMSLRLHIASYNNLFFIISCSSALIIILIFLIYSNSIFAVPTTKCGLSFPGINNLQHSESSDDVLNTCNISSFENNNVKSPH